MGPGGDRLSATNAPVGMRRSHIARLKLISSSPEILNPGALDEERWTLRLPYWLVPTTVLKAAYEWDNPRGESNTNALLLQVAITMIANLIALPERWWRYYFLFCLIGTPGRNRRKNHKPARARRRLTTDLVARNYGPRIAGGVVTIFNYRLYIATRSGMSSSITRACGPTLLALINALSSSS